MIIVIAKVFWLYRIKFDVDDVADHLKPFQYKMSYISRIGFASNFDSNVKYMVYLQVKNRTAPKLVMYEGKLDTLIIVDQKNRTRSSYTGYKVLGQNEDKKLIYLLVVKTK